MAEEIRAQLRADRQQHDRTVQDRRALHTESENAWHNSLPVLDELAREIVATCRELRCRFDVRRVTGRRGWVFDVSVASVRSAPGFGSSGRVRAHLTILVRPNGSWHQISSWDGKPIENPAASWWPAIDPLPLDPARASLKPQIARRAQGRRYLWGHERHYSWD